MESPKSKMTFTHWGEKVSITKPNSDITMEEFWGMCKDIAAGAGFSSEQIKEYFDE